MTPLQRAEYEAREAKQQALNIERCVLCVGGCAAFFLPVRAVGRYLRYTEAQKASAALFERLDAPDDHIEHESGSGQPEVGTSGGSVATQSHEHAKPSLQPSPLEPAKAADAKGLSAPRAAKPAAPAKPPRKRATRFKEPSPAVLAEA